jgi:hypothetical protein
VAEGNSSIEHTPLLRRGVREWPQAGRRRLAGVSDALVSVFFPAGCRICDRLLIGASRVPICGECVSLFVRVSKIACETCGRPLPAPAQKPEQPLLCPACTDKSYAFDRARSFGVYEGTLVDAILLLKFELIDPLGAWFAGRLAEVVHREANAMAAEVVVPVPLHRQRERARVQPGGAALPPPGKAPPPPSQGRPANAYAGPAGQANSHSGRKMGVRTWRFCHTSRQPC